MLFVLCKLVINEYIFESQFQIGGPGLRFKKPVFTLCNTNQIKNVDFYFSIQIFSLRVINYQNLNIVTLCQHSSIIS